MRSPYSVCTYYYSSFSYYDIRAPIVYRTRRGRLIVKPLFTNRRKALTCLHSLPPSRFCRVRPINRHKHLTSSSYEFQITFKTFQVYWKKSAKPQSVPRHMTWSVRLSLQSYYLLVYFVLVAVSFSFFFTVSWIIRFSLSAMCSGTWLRLDRLT